MQESVLNKGDIAVTDGGDVVVLTRIKVRSDSLDNMGRVSTFHTGTVLRSRNTAVGSRFAGKVLRTVCPVEELLRFAEQAGFDLVTPAELPDSELTTIELLQKQVALLQAAITDRAAEPENMQRPQINTAS